MLLTQLSSERLSMTTDSDGLAWKRIDLHFHTPASRDDYNHLAATPEQLVASAKRAGLDGFAVTDHNTGAWIDEMKAAANAEGIVVFPGVEVTVFGGERNVHLLAIFDPSKGTADVHDFLAQVSITEDKRGSTETLASGDVNEVINKIALLGGVPLLAHCDSTSGVTQEIRGQARIKIVQNPNLLGAEITKDETASFFRGDDVNYQRQLAVFQGSDCHSPEEIGRRGSYFKLGAMTVSALRQCLFDPDTRVRPVHYPAVHYPTIVRMEIAGGFFDGVELRLHPGLNTIIGGKGVGKSLLVEFLRFALDQPSVVKAIVEDYETKLFRRLGVGGGVRVVCQMPSGTTYNITRRYDRATNAIAVTDLSDSTPYDGSVASLFPVLAYSQNEVIDISRDRNVQLRLIDRLIDLDTHHREIEECISQLESITDQYIDARSASEMVQSLDVDIATKENHIRELDRVLAHVKFQNQKDWDRRGGLIKQTKETATQYATAAKNIAQDEEAAQLPSLSNDDDGDNELQSYYGAVAQALSKLQTEIKADIQVFEDTMVTADLHRQKWQEMKDQWDIEFQDFLRETGGEQAALSAQRTKLAAEVEDLKQRRQAFVQLASEFHGHAQQYELLLDQLGGAKGRLYHARSEVYVELTKKSSGRLKLNLKAGADISKFDKALEGLFHGMNIQQRYREKLVQTMTPRLFVKAVLNKDQKALESEGGLTNTASTKVVEGIPSNDQLVRQLLSIPYRSMPEDVPEILYQKEDSNYYPLDELSVGQKCTALMLIALSEGQLPIIIDQPEDALDVATVYRDVVQRLRTGKDQRQFVITTHNPNVAVSSDSDKYHVLKGTAATGEIVCAGAIDLENVASEVIEHLEGGVEPYKLRGQKYNV